MYKVLIVDDESLMREGLMSLVDWSGMGFEVVDALEDGREALTYIQDNQIDVLLTDIKMTFVSGLELAKFVYEEKLPIKVILISGFKEFEFARKAVKYNVVNYMLKPIVLKDVRKVLQELKEQLDEEHRTLLISEDRKKRYDNILKYSQDKFFMDVVFGTYNNRNEIMDAIKILGIEMKPDSSKCKIISISIQNYSNFIKDNWNYGKNGLLNAISNFFCNGPSNMILYKISTHKQKIFYLAIDRIGDGERFDNSLKVHIHSVCSNINRILDLGVQIKLEKEFKTIFDLAMMPTSVALTYNSTQGSDTNNNWDFIYIVERNKMLLTHIINKEPRLAVNVFDHFIQEIKPYGVDVAKRVFSDLFNMLMSKMIENGIDVRQKEKELEKRVIITTIDELHKWGLKLIGNLVDSIKTDNKGKENDVISRVKVFIKSHYNEDITLDEAANHVYLSSVYLSRLFKEQTGENFSEYLVKIRLVKAVELLRQPQYKVYEVCQMIGYSSVKYFYRIFKKYYGCTPTEYRKSLNVEGV